MKKYQAQIMWGKMELFEEIVTDKQIFIRVNETKNTTKKTPKSCTESIDSCGRAAKGIFSQPGKYEEDKGPSQPFPLRIIHFCYVLSTGRCLSVPFPPYP